MAKDEEEEVGKGDARRAREGGFGSVRNVEGGRRRGGGACGEPVRCPGRGWKGAKAPAEDERRRKGERDRETPTGSRRLSVLSLTVTAASPEFHPCLIQSSPFFLLLLLAARVRGRERTHRQRSRERESDAEDDAGAAKLDTSPAVLSPSFILRTFYRLPR